MVELHYQAGRWVASCGCCGAPLVGSPDQQRLEAVLAVLGVPPAGGEDLAADDLGRVGD